MAIRQYTGENERLNKVGNDIDVSNLDTSIVKLAVTDAGSKQPWAFMSAVLKARDRQIQLQISMRYPLNLLTYSFWYASVSGLAEIAYSKAFLVSAKMLQRRLSVLRA